MMEGGGEEQAEGRPEFTAIIECALGALNNGNSIQIIHFIPFRATLISFASV